MAFGPPYVAKLTKVAFGPADGTLKYHKVFDYDLTPLEADMFDNNIQVPLTQREKPRVGTILARISFSMHISGSGTVGVAPPDQDLLKACGLSETIVSGTSVTYAADGELNLNDDSNPGDLTAIDVRQYLGNGFCQGIDEAVADAVFEFEPGKPGKATYNIIGQYVAPSEAGSSESAWTATTPVVCTGLDATVAGVSSANLVCRRLRFALNNETVAERDLGSGAVQGIQVPRVVDQAPTIEAEFRLPAQATLNIHNIFTSETSASFTLELGKAEGNTCNYSIDGYLNEPPEIFEQDGLYYCRARFAMDSQNKFQFTWT